MDGVTCREQVDAGAGDLAVPLAQWLNELAVQRRLALKTCVAYMRDVSQFLGFLKERMGHSLGVEALGSLSARDFRAYLTFRRAGGLDNRSLGRHLAALRSFARFLEREGQVRIAALGAVRTPKAEKSLPRPLSAEKACQIVQSMPAVRCGQEEWVRLRDAAALALCYGAGLRISEALSLTLRQFRACDDTLVVRGKGGRQRMVPLLPRIRQMVSAYLAACPWPIDEDAPVFVGVRGGALSPRLLQLTMERLRGMLGLPDSATPHALRHSFASHLLAQGGDLRAIQDLLGHASLSSTQVYTRIDQAQLLAHYKTAHPRAGAAQTR